MRIANLYKPDGVIDLKKTFCERIYKGVNNSLQENFEWGIGSLSYHCKWTLQKNAKIFPHFS